MRIPARVSIFISLCIFLCLGCSGSGGGGGAGTTTPSNQVSNGPVVTVSCGEVITQSLTMANDLQCPGTTPALTIQGNDLTIDGQGHTISAPAAAQGIWVQGQNITVTDVTVRGLTQGSGLFAYDSPNLTLFNDDFSQNQIGINLYAEHVDMGSVRVTGNTANNCTLFGVRIATDGAGSVSQPNISSNDLSNSGLYAFFLESASYELTSSDLNQMTGSQGGIYLRGGILTLHDFDLSSSGVTDTMIFIDSPQSVSMQNVNMNSSSGGLNTDAAISVDLYRVPTFDIYNCQASGSDVGIRLETETGISSTGSVRCSQFSNNSTAAIMIGSNDSTTYGAITLDNNSIVDTKSQAVYIQAGTTAKVQTVSTTICPN